jgi:hypothetical protein
MGKGHRAGRGGHWEGPTDDGIIGEDVENKIICGEDGNVECVAKYYILVTF